MGPDGKSFPAGVRRFESCPQHQPIYQKAKHCEFILVREILIDTKIVS